jgi:hypothetical protein
MVHINREETQTSYLGITPRRSIAYAAFRHFSKKRIKIKQKRFYPVLQYNGLENIGSVRCEKNLDIMEI